MILAMAVRMPSRIIVICSKNASSVLRGRSLMVTRPVWQVMPGTRNSSHSGPTVVLVEGTIIPIRFRYPKVSGTQRTPNQGRFRWGSQGLTHLLSCSQASHQPPERDQASSRPGRLMARDRFSRHGGAHFKLAVGNADIRE